MMMKPHLLILLALIGILPATQAQTSFQADSIFIKKIFDEALANGKSYEWLRVLTTQIGGRLSGSDGAANAVVYTQKVMEDEGFDRVFLQNTQVPHWVRGEAEKAYFQSGTKKVEVPIAALGGSVATAVAGVKAEIIEVKNFVELRALGKEKVAGKIVFFNRPMDPTELSTFDAYRGAVDQRGHGSRKTGGRGRHRAFHDHANG